MSAPKKGIDENVNGAPEDSAPYACFVCSVCLPLMVFLRPLDGTGLNLE
jgi:hypothetical protein